VFGGQGECTHNQGKSQKQANDLRDATIVRHYRGGHGGARGAKRNQKKNQTTGFLVHPGFCGDGTGPFYKPKKISGQKATGTFKKRRVHLNNANLTIKLQGGGRWGGAKIPPKEQGKTNLP